MKLNSLILVLILIAPLASYNQNFKGIPMGTESVKIQNTEFEQEVLNFINEIRLKHSLNPLIWQEDLARAAMYHAQDMALDDYMEHSTYDRQNNRLVKVCGTFERIEKFIDFPYLAENISAGRSNARETVEGWMKSKGHKANILNPKLKFMGVGYFYKKNTKYQHYWVQDFGG